MRVVCAILVAISCAPLLAGGTPDSAVTAPRNPAFQPAPRPPLYFPVEAPKPLPSGPELAERIRQWRESGGAVVLVSQKQPEDEFRPISELPPEEKVPAVRLVVAAYVFVVLGLFAYVLSIARRLNHVGREIARLDAQLKQR
jgi:CcmD family protein